MVIHEVQQEVPKEIRASLQKTGWALEGGWILMIFHKPAIHDYKNFRKSAEPTSLKKAGWARRA